MRRLRNRAIGGIVPPRHSAWKGERPRLDAGVVLATDAHSMRRCSGLSAGFAWVREHIGEERANDLRARADGVLAALLDGK
jgi:hypothetical protein